MAKILIIEDDPLINKMYSEKLTRDGYEVKVAQNGQEGLDQINSFLPDLIMLDIMMPKMSGIEVIYELKKDSKFEKIPIIVLSNLTEGPEIEKAKSMGINEYLIKSDIDPQDVSELIKKYIQ